MIGEKKIKKNSGHSIIIRLGNFIIILYFKNSESSRTSEPNNI